MADLSGVLAKLDRAEEHRLEFDELVEEYVGGEPYTAAGPLAQQSNEIDGAGFFLGLGEELKTIP